jgi:hypothetical protein
MISLCQKREGMIYLSFSSINDPAELLPRNNIPLLRCQHAFRGRYDLCVCVSRRCDVLCSRDMLRDTRLCLS